MIVTTKTVRQAVEATLRAHLPFTLQRVLVDDGQALDALPAPADNAYHELPDEDELSRIDPRTAVIAVVVPDEDYSDPYVGEDDTLTQDAVFQLVVAVTSRGSDHDNTVGVNDMYRAAIRVVLSQHGTLGGLARETNVISASYRPLGDTSRFVLSGLVYAEVEVDCVNPRGADLTDPSLPAEVGPLVESTNTPVYPL